MEQATRYQRDPTESRLSYLQEIGISPRDISEKRAGELPIVERRPLDDDSRAFRERMLESLWLRTGFDATIEQSGLDHDSLLKAAAAAVTSLQAAAQDVARLIDVIWSVNTEYVSDKAVDRQMRGEVLAELKQRMLDRIGADLHPSATPWDGEMDGMAIAIAKIAVRKRLRHQFRAFAEQLIHLLDELAAAEIVGRVLWETETTCDVFFYRELAIYRGKEVTTIRSRNGSEVIHSDLFREIRRETFEVKEYIKHEHEVRQSLYLMKLRKAEAVQVDRSATIVPRTFQPILDALPAWLRPEVKILDGQRYLLQVATWHQEDVKVTKERRWEEQQIFSSPKVVCDPAITLDRYALSGWGPEEEQSEKDRQQAEQLEDEALADTYDAAFMFWPAAFGSAALVIAGTVAALLAPYWAVLWHVGTVVTVAGGFSSGWAISLERRMRRKPFGTVYLALGICAVVFGALAVQMLAFGIWFTSWRHILMGLYPALLAAALVWPVPRLWNYIKSNWNVSFGD